MSTIRIFVNPEGLKRLLLKRGLTQGQFAVRIRVSPATVSRMLSSRRSLTSKRAAIIRQVLRANWDEVFGKVEKKNERGEVILSDQVQLGT